MMKKLLILTLFIVPYTQPSQAMLSTLAGHAHETITQKAKRLPARPTQICKTSQPPFPLSLAIRPQHVQVAQQQSHTLAARLAHSIGTQLIKKIPPMQRTYTCLAVVQLPKDQQAAALAQYSISVKEFYNTLLQHEEEQIWKEIYRKTGRTKQYFAKQVPEINFIINKHVSPSTRAYEGFAPVDIPEAKKLLSDIAQQSGLNADSIDFLWCKKNIKDPLLLAQARGNNIIIIFNTKDFEKQYDSYYWQVTLAHECKHLYHNDPAMAHLMGFDRLFLPASYKRFFQHTEDRAEIQAGLMSLDYSRAIITPHENSIFDQPMVKLMLLPGDIKRKLSQLFLPTKETRFFSDFRHMYHLMEQEEKRKKQKYNHAQEIISTIPPVL